MTRTFFRSAVTTAALLLVAAPASAITLTIQDVEITVEVVSDANDWQWNFAVSVPTSVHQTITSFHVRGLPGDVSDTYEYEDFQPGHLVSPSWTVTTSQPTGAINFSKPGNAAQPLTSGGSLTFSFDSDYQFSDVSGGMFEVGLDFARDPTKVYWQKVSTVPVPAAVWLMAGALLGLGAFAAPRRKAVLA